MFEENAVSQLKLTKEISQARRVQLAAIDQALLRLNCAGSSRECRTITGVAKFLAILAGRAEDLIAAEITNALHQLDALKELPDQAQWEYRIANSLGVAEGLNRAGVVQARVIEQAQASLHKASILLLTQGPKTDLPVWIKSQRDYIQTIMIDLNPRHGRRIGTANQLSEQMCGAFLKRARQADNDVQVSISSTCLRAIDLTMGSLLATLSGFAREAIQCESYENDPAHGVTAGQYHMARLIAAGTVSVLVADLLKEHAPWVSVSCN